MKYTKWVKEIQAEEGFGRWFRDWTRNTPPKTKISVCLDRNLPQELIEGFRSTARVFRVVHVSAPNESDASLYQSARSEGALIVTCDEDFWDDSGFPLRASPGVIVLKGVNSEELSSAILRFLEHVDVVGAIRRMPDWAFSQKFKASPVGFVRRTLTHDSRVETETIEY